MQPIKSFTVILFLCLHKDITTCVMPIKECLLEHFSFVSKRTLDDWAFMVATSKLWNTDTFKIVMLRETFQFIIRTLFRHMFLIVYFNFNTIFMPFLCMTEHYIEVCTTYCYFSTEIAGFSLLAAVHMMTPNLEDINSGVLYLRLGSEEYRFLAPCYWFFQLSFTSPRPQEQAMHEKYVKKSMKPKNLCLGRMMAY